MQPDDIVTLKVVGERLKARRKGRQLPQAAVAEAAGVAQATYRSWEPDEHGNVSEGGCVAVARAARFLQMTPNELLLAGELAERLPPRASDKFLAIVEQLVPALIQMDELCAGATVLPSQIFTRHATDLLKSMERDGQSDRPMLRIGTGERVDVGDGTKLDVTTVEPVQKGRRAERRRKKET